MSLKNLQLPVVEITILRQDERDKDLLLCVASELASEKNGWQVNFAECVFLIITMEKYVS